MADLEERIKMFLKQEEDKDGGGCDGGGGGDTFGERAEWFFKKRPQLLELLQDLYNGYTALLDRCSKLEGKHKRPSSLNESDAWDVESSLSYQQQTPTSNNNNNNIDDEIVAHLVVKNVEEDLLKRQILEMEKQCNESSRKIDLLKKLLEVLESERILLLNENTTLGYKVGGLTEENEGLSSEVMFLKKRAAQLATCVLQMREDHRVYLLTRKIEDLQNQINGLEKRNKDYYYCYSNQQLPTKDKLLSSSSINNGGLMGCFQMERIKKNPKRVPNWWAKVKKSITPTPSSPSSSYST